MNAIKYNVKKWAGESEFFIYLAEEEDRTDKISRRVLDSVTNHVFNLNDATWRSFNE